MTFREKRYKAHGGFVRVGANAPIITFGKKDIQGITQREYRQSL
jgi:hypothetical protein